MKRSISLVIGILIALPAVFSRAGLAGASRLAEPLAPQAGAPSVVSYQGQVTLSGTPYTGAGYFKFAVVDAAGTTTYWSNDNTSTGGGEPTAPVSLAVSNGLFNVLLGDTSLTNMGGLPASAFSGVNRYLRVWFSGSGTTPLVLLTPDRRIAAVPYALQAEEAKNAWSLAGNADTTPGTNFLGTTDNNTLVFKTNNTEWLRLDPSGRLDVAGSIRTDSQLVSTVGTGAAPLALSSTTQVNNLNADLLDGSHASALQNRVTGTCSAGNAISAVNADGTVVCEVRGGRPILSLTGVFSRVDVDGGGDVGRYTSIAIGADGLPVVSYHDWTNHDLRVLHCGDRGCTAGNTITLVDTAGDTGYETSITIGADGLPVISYRDETNKFLKVLHCGTIACTVSNSITPVDTAANTGHNSAITLGADGLPVVSYLDGTNADLKVLHCGNAACSTGTPRPPWTQRGRSAGSPPLPSASMACPWSATTTTPTPI